MVPEKNLTENDTVLEKVNSDANKINEEVKESDTNETAVQVGDLPPPPSKDQILGKC